MTVAELPELRSSFAHSFSYSGDRVGWHLALSVHRDSEALDRSNWEVITEEILAIPDEGDPEDELADAAIERMSHWAVGWIDYLVVRPHSTAEKRAIEWKQKLDDYPVADEEHYSQIEWNEEWCVRCDRGTREQHDDSFRCKFRSAEEADEIKYKWRNHG